MIGESWNSIANGVLVVQTFAVLWVKCPLPTPMPTMYLNIQKFIIIQTAN